jgi:Rha family phage regulatory protein
VHTETEASRLPVVFVQDGEVFADSRHVASFFDKQHGHVLRDIDHLCGLELDLKNREFTESRFSAPLSKNGESNGINYIGPEYRCYHMTRDGFMLLAMGFSGGKALKLKRAHIAGFNDMERELWAEKLKAATPAPLDAFCGPGIHWRAGLLRMAPDLGLHEFVGDPPTRWSKTAGRERMPALEHFPCQALRLRQSDA